MLYCKVLRSSPAKASSKTRVFIFFRIICVTLRTALAGLILSLMSVTQSSGGPSPSTGFAAAALLNKLTDAALLSLQAV